MCKFSRCAGGIVLLMSTSPYPTRLHMAGAAKGKRASRGPSSRKRNAGQRSGRITSQGSGRVASATRASMDGTEGTALHAVGIERPPVMKSPLALRQRYSETGRAYFDAHATTGGGTSADTLSSVRLPAEAVLNRAIRELPGHVPSEAEDAMVRAALRPERMGKLRFWLAAGHSLLFYGFGSKIRVLDDFAQRLADTTKSAADVVYVIKGYQPSLSLRTSLAEIASDVVPTSIRYTKRHLLDYVQAIRNALSVNCRGKRASSRHVYLVVHNIDGIALRSTEAQHVLSELAAIENLSLVASIDHVNAPILWDGTMYTRFRWAWTLATTFMPYTEETAFAARALLSDGNERKVESASVVLKSLSDKARKIFRLLAEFQCGRTLATQNEGDDQSGPGEADGEDRESKRRRVDSEPNRKAHAKHKANSSPEAAAAMNRTTFNEFYNQCREKFLASDPASLKTMLIELETHELLDRRKAADAAEKIWIPLTVQQLQDIVKNLDIVDE
jgi:origin recognition complex subunit 2